MASGKLTVVISQAPGKNPVKRALEEDIAVQLMLGGQVDVSVIPHLYDLPADHTGLMFLRSLPGHFVILSWLYPRAAHWVLDRQKIGGRLGKTRLVDEDEDEAETDDDSAKILAEMNGAHAETASETHGKPSRTIWSIDLRVRSNAAAYVEEIQRIAAEIAIPVVSLGLSFPLKSTPPQAPSTLPVISPPTPISEIGAASGANTSGSVQQIGTEELTKRRWYPVIDYSRCTNCMECIDFCLFGVYGVDALDRILVEQQDSCKKGCPACSRVCPANAIIFPEHKTAAIAGADGDGPAAFKVDLSKLFGGGNDSAESALEMAVKERDQELVADGREAVGMKVGIPKRQEGKAQSPRDNLDDLLDSLDNF